MAYPADTTPIPAAPDGTETLGGSTPTHTEHHDALVTGVNAVFDELGATPSAGFDTVGGRLAALDENVFHVESPEFGAVGDGTTDDSAAIIAAIDACAAAGGGTVQFGAKTYLCNGSLVTTENGYAVLPIPNSGSPIRLRGVQPANNCDPRTSTGYSVIKTTKTGLTHSGTYGTPSLIGGPTDGTWAETMVSIEDLCLWLPKNPTIAGIDLLYVRRCLVDGVAVQAIDTGDADYTEPTSEHAFGLRTPEAQNYNAVLIRSGQAHGMYAGLVGSVESLTVDYWVSKWCVVGWSPMPGGHGAAVQKMSLEWCQYHLSGWSETGGFGGVPTGPFSLDTSTVHVAALALEDHTGSSKWYDTVDHIHDPTDRIYGVVFHELWDGTGPSASITKDGAANLTTVPLLAPSFGGGGSLTVQDENGTVSSGVTQIDFQGAVVAATAGSGEVIVTITGDGTGSGSTGELVMQDGVTSPPAPLENEAGTDWLYTD